MNYYLKQDLTDNSIIYLKYNDGKKRRVIGSLFDLRMPDNEYSRLLNANCASLYYIQLFKQYTGRGHFINLMKLLIKELNGFDNLIIRKPLDESKWSSLAVKLLDDKLITDFSFGTINEPFLRLII